MKLYQIVSILMIAAFGFTACEEVIILDLQNDAPKIVIEAVVDATNQTATVILTKSNGFYDEVRQDLVTNATVTLTLADGSFIALSMISDGLYAAFGLNVAEGDALTMTVIDGGTVYAATTNVPHAVAIDSLELLEQASGGFRPGGTNDKVAYQIFTHWQDVADVESFYRIRAIVNDNLQTGSYALSNDFNRNGANFSQPIFQLFEAGDTVTIQLLSLDKSAYYYFEALSGVQGQGFNSTTPYNPMSNFTNNALGYFGIIKTDEKTVIL